MASVFDKSRGTRVPFALRGLTERQLTHLYNVVKIKKMNPGEKLFTEGDVDLSLWFILEGSLKIERKLDGRDTELMRLSPGTSVEEIDPKKNHRRTVSAFAVEPSALLELDEQSLNVLPPDIQSSIYKSLYRRIGGRLSDAVERERDLREKDRRLISYFRDHLRSKDEAYADSEIIQRIIKGFPRLPTHSSQLAVRLLDEEVPVSEVVNLAKFDPSLVSLVLRTANSAYYNLQKKVADIQRAVLFLGFNQVYQLIITEGLRTIMPKGPRFQELLFHSVLISLLCFEIAQIYHLKGGERHSTIGLLHDIGKSVILLLKQEYPKLQTIVDLTGHCKIGSLLLKEWNIPDVICLSLEIQNYPAFSPPEEIPAEQKENVSVLYLAHLCETCLQDQDRVDLYSPFHKEYLGLLNSSEGPVPDLVKRKILPSMMKRLHTFPDDVRRLLKASETRCLEKGSSSGHSEELPIVWNV